MAMAITERARQDELLQIRNDLMTLYREIGGGDSRLFPLRYARSGAGIAPHDPGAATSGTTTRLEDADETLPPILILPDGPGTASVLPYDVLRRMMTQRGLDVIMMEHRGVGLSRLDAEGRDLPAEAITLDAVIGDILSVLEHARVPRACVYGVGYGAYLAQLLAARHPERVHSLVLDSPRVSAEDDRVSQRALRSLYLDGDDERTESTAAVLRRLIADGTVDGRRCGPVLAAAHQYGGPGAVGELVDLLSRDRGRLTSASIRQALTRRYLQSTPYVQENDLVARIAHTELGWGAAADGQDVDPLEMVARQGDGMPPFTGEENDLRELAGTITAPALVLSGAWDLVSPAPIARDLATRIPRATLIELPRIGHSVLDSHPTAAIIAAWWSAAGAGHRLTERVAELDRVPRVSLNRALSETLRLALLAERISPWRLWVQTARSRRAEAELDPAHRRARGPRGL